MEPTSVDTIDIELENALQLLIKREQQELAARIRPILYVNKDKGRITWFIEGQMDRVRDYVFRVAEYYQAQNVYLEKIKIERATEVWEPLFAEMQKWAYSYLKRKDFSGDLASQENAIDCATEAAILLLKAHFPYDTDFKPWAHVIVRNACQKFVQGYFKKTNYRKEEDLVNLEDLLEQLKDHSAQEKEQQKEVGAELRSALAELSEARQSVIEHLYFSDLSVGEISEKMGKSPGAIHSLHFNALNDLQKILNQNRDNTNG